MRSAGRCNSGAVSRSQLLKSWGGAPEEHPEGPSSPAAKVGAPQE